MWFTKELFQNIKPPKQKLKYWTEVNSEKPSIVCTPLFGELCASSSSSMDRENFFLGDLIQNTALHISPRPMLYSTKKHKKKKRKFSNDIDYCLGISAPIT
jgi:hypothetical protein